MNRGRPGAVLSPQDRQRLRTFRARHGNYLGVHLGLPALRTAMQAPFTWETLQRALEGLPVSPETRDWIVSFLDRQQRSDHDPQSAAALDFKSRAAGEKEEPNGEETTSAARTVRGSR